MDRKSVKKVQKDPQISYEEIIAELSSQIGNLNTELLISKMALKKLQESISNLDSNDESTSNDF